MVDEMEPQWLDEQERQAWLALAAIAVQLGPALDAQLRQDAGISFFEYSAMAWLSEAPDRTRRMSDLATLLASSLSRLSQVVSRLENKGWVRRTQDPSDGRVTLATLTDAGWDLMVAAAPKHVSEVRRIVIDPLTRTQLQQVASIGDRILRVLVPPERRTHWPS